jgi:hypothetical protein
MWHCCARAHDGSRDHDTVTASHCVAHHDINAIRSSCHASACTLPTSRNELQLQFNLGMPAVRSRPAFCRATSDTCLVLHEVALACPAGATTVWLRVCRPHAPPRRARRRHRARRRRARGRAARPARGKRCAGQVREGAARRVCGVAEPPWLSRRRRGAGRRAAGRRCAPL